MRYNVDMQPEVRHRDLSDLAGSMTAADAQALLESVAESDGASLAMQTNRDPSFMGDLSDADAQAISEAHESGDQIRLAMDTVK